MADVIVERAARLFIAAEKRIRAAGLVKGFAARALIAYMLKRKLPFIEVCGVRLICRRRKVYGSPSQRRQWRANKPAPALDQWSQPYEIVSTFIRPQRAAA